MTDGGGGVPPELPSAAIGVAERSAVGEGGCVSPSGDCGGENDGMSSKYGVKIPVADCPKFPELMIVSSG